MKGQSAGTAPRIAEQLHFHHHAADIAAFGDVLAGEVIFAGPLPPLAKPLHEVGIENDVFHGADVAGTRPVHALHLHRGRIPVEHLAAELGDPDAIGEGFDGRQAQGLGNCREIGGIRLVRIAHGAHR